MGNDTALACLSDQARPVYDYFRQLFAQITNPPGDFTREPEGKSLYCIVGGEGNLLEVKDTQCHRLLLTSPVLTIEETNALKQLKDAHADWPSRVVDITFAKSEGLAGYETCLDRVCAEVSQAITENIRVIVLSDRNVSADRVAMSALIATGGVHHHLIRNKARAKAAIIVETGEAREIHHICVLLGYGADGVCPYLCYEAMLKLRREGLLKAGLTEDQVIDNYKRATDGGILKVMSKMGISTLASYKVREHNLFCAELLG